MATTIGALRVELSANIAKFERAMGKAAKNMARTQRSFERFGQRAGAAGRSLSVGLTAPLVAVGALAAKSFLSFEQGMNKVAAVSGATGAEMAELTAIAKDLGATTSFSAAQAAEGLGFLAQAGFDATEAGKALPGVLQLAAAGGIELAAAADIATNVLAGYGLEVDQLARVNDVLAKASSSANTDVLQLGQAFKFAGPVARSAGISFEQSGAAMALMGNAGIQAEMAGTALRGAITKLVNPSKEAATTMAELGISATDSEGRLRPLDEIIEQLAPHADNTGAIMQIFGQRAGPAMAALVSQGADALREMTTALEQSGGTAQEIAEKKLAGLTGAWTRLQSATEGVFIEIGSRLSPVLERLAATITDRILPAVRDALDAFGRLSPEVQTSRILWLGFAAALGPALLAIGGVALALTPLVPLFGRIWIAAGRMSNALVKALGHPIATAQALRARIVTLRTSLTGLSLSARASAVGVKLASVALTGLRFAIRGVIAALGPMIAVFAAFEFAAWAAGALDLGGKLKRLVGITDDAADAARDADAACEGLNDTLTDTAETVETAWVRRIQDLEQAMLMGTASIGQLDAEIRHALQSVNITDDVILALASALRYTAVAAGEHLTPAMQEIIDRADEITRTAKESAAGIDDLSESATGAGQPVDDLGDGVGTLSEEVQALVDRLRGTGAIQAAHDWAAAVEDVGGLTRLTDQQTADLNETLQAALSAYQQLGDEAPARLVALAAETGRAVARMREPLQGLVDDVFSLQAVAATSRQALADLITTQGLVGNVQFGRTLASTPMAIDTLGVTVPVLVKPEFDLRTTGQKLPEQLSKSFAGFGDQIGPTFVRALEGGGQWRGAMQSLGVQGGTRLGEALSGGLATTMATETSVFSKGIGQFFGQAMGQAIPFIGPIVGLGIGKIFGLFKKPSEAELAARKHAKDYEDTIIKSLKASQLKEAAEAAQGHWAGNARGAKFLIGVRDAYVAAGKSAAEGEAIVGRYWKAVRDGSPEAVAAITTHIDAVVQVGREQQQRIAELEQMREAGQAAFNPAQIEPYLEKLLETSTITEQQAAELRALADDAHTDWQAMEDDAIRYGVATKDNVEAVLGVQFAQAKLTDEAGRLAAAWHRLTDEGGNVQAVTTGMTDEAQGFVTKALEMGIALPAAMQPMIEKMIEHGRLTDLNSQKLTDLSGLTFAEPLAAKFDTLITKLTELIEKIAGRGGVTEAIDHIPREVEVGVGLRYREHDRPEGFAGVDVEYARHGTPFRQFGRGTPAMLHGLERVMTGMEGRGIAAALGRIQQGLGAIANLSGVRALAKGGWVTRPTLALLGERGPEAVIPQSQIGRLGTSVQVHVDARGALFTDEYTSQRELARIISDVIVSDLEGTRRLGLH